MTWSLHVLSMEIRKVFSYRVAFWMRFILGTITEISVAYFLWKAVFEHQGVQELNGYKFHGLLFYYVFASFASKIILMNDQGPISKEIYEGGLTRYLLYPVSFIYFKYVANVGQQLVAVFQFFLGFSLAALFFGLPVDQNITLSSIILGIFTALCSGGLLFLINSCLELVSFWQDVVWNLMAMLRFIGNLLGGLTIPLVFFPEWAQHAVYFTPFPVIYSFPIRCFLGQVGVTEWFTLFAQMIAWSLAFLLLLNWIWQKGTKRYTGVGI